MKRRQIFTKNCQNSNGRRFIGQRRVLADVLWLVTIYAPMIYTRTAPCIMFWMRAYPLRGEVGGGWALEFSSFLGPVKWLRADKRVPLGVSPSTPLIPPPP
jgi:hypothetical protein